MRFISKILKLANNDVCVAISAGIDSLACLHWLKTKYPRIALRAFYFNHRLRPQNLQMEISCRKFCQEFHIGLIVKERKEDGFLWDNNVFPPSDKFSESDMRKCRYEAMEGLGYVVTAHHLNDGVESYLMNCFNGVPEYLPIPLVTVWNDVENLNVIRPFILNTKEEFREYAAENNLNRFVVEDETNVNTIYRRNWIRQDIIPTVNGKGFNLETIVRKKYLKYIEDNY